ncbi:MAG: Gfo/Idh/MocA family oxidoreductase [Dehalococcoidia bacterium]
MTVGVVGLGRWGPRLAQVLDTMPQAELSWLCDHNPEAHLALGGRFPGAHISSDLDDLLNDEDLDAVVVTTPTASHYELVRRVIEAEKHVLVEKPLALRSQDADDLVYRAERSGRRLVVGNMSAFHPGVRRLKKLIDLGRLGEVYSLEARHHSSPPAGEQENVLWSVGAGDISLLIHLLGDEPIEVLARGGSYVKPGIPDAVACYLRFATGIAAYVYLSLLDARPARSLTVVGSRRTATFDDTLPERKLTIYDRDGDFVSPRLVEEESLRLECEHFVAAIRSNGEAAAEAREGAAVVNVLEELQRSLEEQGAARPLEAFHSSPKVVALPLPARGKQAR